LKISSRFPSTEPTLSGTIVRCLIELESGKATIGFGEFKIEIKTLQFNKPLQMSLKAFILLETILKKSHVYRSIRNWNNRIKK
jgi:hypothetical protein